MPPGGLGRGTAAEWARIPDYIPVTTRDSLGIAGYIKKFDLFPLYDGRHVPGGPIMPVYADGGSPLVGHFYQCKGFVALNEDPNNVSARCSSSVVTAPNMVHVPNVLGMHQAQAARELAGAGLASSVTTSRNASLPAGIIAIESPVANSTVTRGTVIALVVSSGP